MDNRREWHDLFASIEAGLNPSQIKQIVDQGSNTVDAYLNPTNKFTLLLVDWSNAVNQLVNADLNARQMNQSARHNLKWL